MTQEMIATPTYRALSIHAHRVLAFLIHEHLAHGGRENGGLGASYRQLEIWGSTRDDIRRALDELIATGFVRRISLGLRQAGGGDPSRFALTWLPTFAMSAQAEPATHEWRRIAAGLVTSGTFTPAAVRTWLKTEVSRSKRGATPKKTERNSSLATGLTPQLRPVGGV